MKRAILSGLATLLASLPLSLGAQSNDSFYGPGWAGYFISGLIPDGRGEEFSSRWVIINTGSDDLTPQLIPCDVLETEIEIRLLEPIKTCSDGSLPIAPGDSVWAEIRGLPDEPRRFYPIPRAVRIPYLLLLDNRSSRSDLDAFDLQVSVDLSLSEPPQREAPTRALVFPVERTAAVRMAGMAPYLELRVDVNEMGRFQVKTCWRGADDVPLYRNCDRVRIQGSDGPMHFALQLSRLLQGEVGRRLVLERD